MGSIFNNVRRLRTTFWVLAAAGLVGLNVLYISSVEVGRTFLEDRLTRELLVRETRLTGNMLDFIRVQAVDESDDTILSWLDDPLLSFGTILEPALQFSEMIIGIRHYDPAGQFFQAFPPDQPFGDLDPMQVDEIRESGPQAEYVEDFDLSQLSLVLQLSQDRGNGKVPMILVRLPVSGTTGGAMDGGIVEFYQSGRPFKAEVDRMHRDISRLASRLKWTGCGLMTLGLSAVLLVLYRNQQQLVRQTTEIEKANGELLRFAKSSALGSLSVHLIHGLKGPVISMKQMIDAGARDASVLTPEDWEDSKKSAGKVKQLLDDVIGMIQDEKRGDQGQLTVGDMLEFIQRKYADRPGLRTTGRSMDELVSGLELGVRDWNLVVLVMTNLIDNAFQSTADAPEVVVDISVSGDRLLARISDNGEGIPENLISQLFEPKVSGKSSGSGIGLAISRQLIRQAGGTLELESSSHDGTTFVIGLGLQQRTGASTVQ